MASGCIVYEKDIISAFNFTKWLYKNSGHTAVINGWRESMMPLWVEVILKPVNYK